MNLIHVSGQPCWHDDAAIIGTKESLQHLLEAINKALHSDEVASLPCYQNDGEGYQLHVIPLDEATMQKMATCYNDELSKERRPDVLWLFDILKYDRDTKTYSKKTSVPPNVTRGIQTLQNILDKMER